MNTIIEKVMDLNEDKETIEKASKILINGGLVAFPTETVYGLGADALNETAAARIYQAKGRPSDNPLIVHISHTKSVYELAQNVNSIAEKLMEAFWPGPLTLIFKKLSIVPDGTTGGLDTVAIRMPSHKVARELINKSGVYIAAPSANLSGRPSPTVAEHVIEDLSGKIDMIIDGGPVGIGIESTIVDVSGETPMILRPGYITKAMLEEVVGKVNIDPAITNLSPDTKPKAPGMKYTHYAPKGELTIVEGKDINKVVGLINDLASNKREAGYKVGIIATDETKNLYKGDIVISIGSRKNDDTIAARLYKVLRDFDQLGMEYMYTESFENDDLGYAIMNRLIKAAGHRVVEI